MPVGLSEFAAEFAAPCPSPTPAADRLEGPQQKRKRTQAPPSRFQDQQPTVSADNPEQGIQDEVQRIKQSMARLESLLSQRTSQDPTPNNFASAPTTRAAHDYQLDPSQDLPGETHPPSRDDCQRWQNLRSILPPLIDTHRMMHYMLTEGDWLMTCTQAPRFVAFWKHAFERQAISDIFAVQVLALVALSAVLLSDNPQRTIQFAVPIRSLHTILAKEAVNMIESMPALRSGRTEAETCDYIEMMLNTSLYFRCIGKDVRHGRYIERAISVVVRAGFDNELRPSWIGLTQDQVERRRRLLIELALSTKWYAFHCRADLAPLRITTFNFGLAHLKQVAQLPSLKAWPQSDQIARTSAAAAAQPLNAAAEPFFAWRNKSERERQTVRDFILISSSLTDEIPSVVDLVSKTESRLLHPEVLAKCTKEEMRDMARQTRQILARLEEWHNVILPRAGVGYNRAVDANITSADPVQAKTMATNLMLNFAGFYMNAIVCRAWLLMSDRLQSLIDARQDKDDEYEKATTLSSDFLAHLKQRTIDDRQHASAAWLPPTFLSEVEAATVQNGRRCIRSLGVIRKLQSLPSSQFFVGWTSQAHMQVAVNLAIPLVRSHRRQHHGHADRADSGYADASLDSLRRDVVTILEAVSQLSNNYMAHRTAKVLNRALRFGGIERPMVIADDNADAVEDAWWAEEQATSSSATIGQMQNAAEGLALLSAASSARTASDSAASRHSASREGSDSSSPGVSMLAWQSSSQGFGTGHSHSVPFQDSSAPASYPTTSAGVSSASAAAPVLAASGAADGVAREPMWWEARTPVEKSLKGAVGVGMGAHTGDSSVMGHHSQQPTQPQQHHMTDSQLLDELLNLDTSFWQFLVEGAGASNGDTSAASTSVRP